MTRQDIFDAISIERNRQISIGRMSEEDKGWSENEWVAFITTYAGKASSAKTNRGNSFQHRMIQVAALAVAALEAGTL